MAKVKLNPILAGIHGRMGNAVFYCRNGRQYIRMHVIGRNPDTEAQRTVRRTFAGAVKSWQAMTSGERSEFKRKARSLNMSGYNLHISRYLKTRLSGASTPYMKKGTDGMYFKSSQIKLTSVSPSQTNRIMKRMPFISLKSEPG